MNSDFVPFVELFGIEMLEKRSAPRAMKTHLPYDMLPHDRKGKYIYVLRNPKDALTSLYHHMQSPREFFNFTGGSFDGFFDYELNDRPVFGDYFDHLLR